MKALAVALVLLPPLATIGRGVNVEDGKLIISKSDYEVEVKETEKMLRVPETYIVTAYGISEFYDLCDKITAANESDRFQHMLDLYVYLSEGKTSPDARSYVTNSRINSVTYYANETKEKSLVVYFNDFSQLLLELAKGKDPETKILAIRILKSMFHEARNMPDSEFDKPTFKFPLPKAWKPILEGNYFKSSEDLIKLYKD